MIETVAGKDTAFALPTEIILGEGLFIGEGGIFTSLSFFDTNWSLRNLFSFIRFNHAKDKISISA